MRTGRDALVDLPDPAHVGFSKSLFWVKGLFMFSIPNGYLFQLFALVQLQLVDPNTDPKTQKFHVFVIAIISSQT